MSKKNKDQTSESGKKEESKTLFEASRRVLLAAIGAAALAQDEIEDFVEKLVDRGEIAEKDGKKLVREVLDRRSNTRQEVEDQAHKLLQEALTRMNIPSKKDIDGLSEKIAELSRKISDLEK